MMKNGGSKISKFCCTNWTDKSRRRDEHRLSGGPAAGHQHVGTRLLWSRWLPRLGTWPRPVRQRYHHQRSASSSSELEIVACDILTPHRFIASQKLLRPTAINLWSSSLRYNYYTAYMMKLLFTSDEARGKCFLPMFVCLSVCEQDYSKRRAYNIDLDEMLRVDRCWDMYELINFWARSGL